MIFLINQKNGLHKKRTVFIIRFLVGFKLLSQSIKVPIDYKNLKRGNFELQYKFGYEFNPTLPTVIVIADAQQFYVRKDQLKEIQDKLFDKSFNVLGIILRSTNKDLRAKVQLQNEADTNWEIAYSVYQSFQFANDIETVINTVLKNEKVVYL